MRDIVLHLAASAGTHTPLLLLVLVLVVAGAGSMLPVSPVEPLVVLVALVSPRGLLAPMVIVATASHMAAKTLLFLGSRRAAHILPSRRRASVERVCAMLARRPAIRDAAVFASAIAGMPPFYATTVAAGALAMPLRDFVILGTLGRGARFAALVLAPRLLAASILLALVTAQPLHAQDDGAAMRDVVRDVGGGSAAWVLLAGTVGGVAGFGRLEARLLARGDRVVVIDAYRLSVDSEDVSFAALARRVDALLVRHGVSNAHVVGHAHGGGIGLRLAAQSPARVADVTLLDVGALASSRSQVLSAALRLVPLVARMPGGRDFLRRRFLAGLRENSVRHEWLDSSTQRAYVDPLFSDIDRVVRMAVRVANAREPEPLEQVLARIRVPVTVIAGGVRTPAGPTSAEFIALRPLAPRMLTVERTGHFPHEEAPDEVVALLAPVTVANRATGGHR